MAIKISTGLRNHILATGSVKAALASGEIRIYAGTVPADADASIGAATLLCTIKNGASQINFDAAAAAGVLAKAPAETWSGVNAASGTAAFYRHILPADSAGPLSTTALRIQGTCAVAGADMNLTSTALVSGATQTIDFYTVAMPAG